MALTVKDILEHTNTDSVVIARTINNNVEILVDCETPYIMQSCEGYLWEEVDYIVPLNNKIEINIK